MTETDPAPYDDKPIPEWQKLTAAAVAALVVAALVAWRDRLGADFWPIDASRVGPNLLASVVQWAVVLTIAALIRPPTRRRIHLYIESHTGPLHAHLAAHREAQSELRRRLDHIIQHHPEIPDLPDA